MLSKRSAFQSHAVLLVVSISLSACGMFGQKTDLNDLLAYGSKYQGCLNELGPRFEQFIHGTVSEKEWDGTWTCTIESLEMFTKFVREGAPGGYTQDDIHSFVKNVLVTARPVSMDLIAAAFRLKASILGGNDLVISKAELRRFLDLLRLGKTETTKLLPFLTHIHTDSNPQAMIALADAIQRHGTVLADWLKPEGNVEFPDWALGVLLEELGKSFGWDLQYDLMRPILAIKSFLLAGSDQEIEAAAWPRFIKTASALGGAVTALVVVKQASARGPNEYGEFLGEIIMRIKAVLDQTLVWHDGRLTETLLNELVLAFPDRWFGSVRKVSISYSIRPFIQKILRSPDPAAITADALNNLLAEFLFWNRGISHLEKIFLYHQLNPDAFFVEDFERAATEYATDLDLVAKAEIGRLVTIAKTFRPLLVSQDREITFSPDIPYTLNNLKTNHWLQLLGTHLIGAYSTLKDPTSAAVKDFREFFENFTPLGIDLGVIDRDVPGIYEKRFREADLFNYASNGDSQLSVNEAVYMGAFLTSISLLANRILDDIEPICSIAGQGKTMRGRWMNVDCFRNEYLANVQSYWKRIPALRHYYSQLDGNGQRTLLANMEKGARRYGYSQYDIGEYDVQGMAGVVHYVEGLFQRYDVNRDQHLDTGELHVAYPVFKTTIASLGGLKPEDDGMIEAVFTYLIKHGEAPQKTLGGIIKLLWWKLIGKSNWKLSSDRGGIFQVTSYFGSSEVIPTTLMQEYPEVFPDGDQQASSELQ